MADLDTLVYQYQRELQLVVKINGVNFQPITTSALSDSGVPGISGIRVSKALDTPVPVCDIEISHLATWISRGMSVTVDAGYVGAPSKRIFTGYVQSRERKIAGATLRCLGKSYSLFRTINIGDVNVSGKTVNKAIKDILTDVGITDRNINVGAFTLNTSGQDSMKLERMPASQMVQMLADIDGSRIFETNFGTIIIGPLEEVPAPTAAYTYTSSTQATAIILGGSDREDPDYFRNQVIVTGATKQADGDTEATTLTATAELVDAGGMIQPPMPAGTVIGTEYSNQLIDTQAQCDALALTLLSRFARIPRYLTLEIAGDPRVDIGMTISLTFTHMGIASSRWFVHGVSHSIDNNGGYRTTLQLRGGDLLGGSLTLAPVATFSAMSEVENMGGRMITVIHLDASASYDPDGSIATWVWTANQPITMGSGETLTVNADTTGWVGDLEITLTVTDNDGAVTTSTQVVPYGGAADVVIPSMYAAINNNATATLDGGRTWNNQSGSTCISVGARPEDGVLTGYACFGFSNGVIKRTTDGCATALTTVYTLASGAAINDIQWDWRNLNVVWAVSEDGQVLISLDAGVTWSVYSALRTTTFVSGTASVSGALLNKIGLPAGGGVYVFGGTGAGSPLIAYDAIVGAKAWVNVTFTGDLLTDTVTTPADATMRIIDYDAPGNVDNIECMILAWASGGGASITAVYYADADTSPPGPTRAFTRATTTFGGLKTGRFVVGDTTQFHCAFANRSVWHSTNGADWTETANVFPANTVPWHAIWFGRNQGLIQGGIFAAALEDTVTPNNGYIVKSVDGFITAPIMRPTTGDIAVTWPASAKGKKLSIGASIGSVAAEGNLIALTTGGATNTVTKLLAGTAGWTPLVSVAGATLTGESSRVRAFSSDLMFVSDVDAAANGAGAGLYRSINGGATWAATSLTQGVDICRAANGRLWAIERTAGPFNQIKIYRDSMDDGATWNLIATIGNGTSESREGLFIVAHPLDTNIIAVWGPQTDGVAGGFLSHTTDGTAASPTFSTNTSTAPSRRQSQGASCFAILPNGRWVIGTNITAGSTAWSIVTTDDKGATAWTTRYTSATGATNAHLGIGVNGSKLVVLRYLSGTGDAEPIVSTDSGTTWAALAGIQTWEDFTGGTAPNVFAYDPLSDTIYVGDDNVSAFKVVRFSPVTTGGIWSDVSLNIPDNRLVAMAVIP